MSNFFTNNVDLSSNNIFQPLGAGTALTYDTGYTSNGVDLRYLFLPYFISKVNATGYLYQNNDLCNIFNKRLPFAIGSGLTYVGGGSSNQFPVAVNPSHSLLYVIGGSGTLQIIDSSTIVAVVLVGGGGGGGTSRTSSTSFSRIAGNGGQVRIHTTGFSNTTYNLLVGTGGTVGNKGNQTAITGFIPATGGGSINTTGGNFGNGVLVSYNNLYYGGAGGSACADGFVGGGGGGGGDTVRLTSGTSNGISGGRGYGQQLNVYGGSGGAGGNSTTLSGGIGGNTVNGAGGGGGGSGYVTVPTNSTGTAYNGGNGGDGNVATGGYKFVSSTSPPVEYTYSPGAGGAGNGGTNSGGGGGMPGVAYSGYSGGYQPVFSMSGSGGSGIIIVVYT